MLRMDLDWLVAGLDDAVDPAAHARPLITLAESASGRFFCARIWRVSV